MPSVNTLSPGFIFAEWNRSELFFNIQQSQALVAKCVKPNAKNIEDKADFCLLFVLEHS